MDSCPTYDATGLEKCENDISSLSTEDQSPEGIFETKKSDPAINRTLPLTENATNSHPLMHSPGSAMSPDFPDLIPEQAKNKYKEIKFNPQANSTALENSNDSCDSFQRQLNLPILDYDEKLPGKFTPLYNLQC